MELPFSSKPSESIRNFNAKSDVQRKKALLGNEHKIKSRSKFNHSFYFYLATHAPISLLRVHILWNEEQDRQGLVALTLHIAARNSALF